MVRMDCLLILYAVLMVAFPSRGKRIIGWCPSNSRYVLLVGCALALNSTSTRTATREQYKQIETYVQLPWCLCRKPWLRLHRTIVGDQLHESFRRWLSPPDPSKNHNIARKAHHEGSAEWFVHGNTFSEWKWKTGSLLWIHGKRASPPFPLSIPCF